jgi:hypothetical protein
MLRPIGTVFGSVFAIHSQLPLVKRPCQTRNIAVSAETKSSKLVPTWIHFDRVSVRSSEICTIEIKNIQPSSWWMQPLSFLYAKENWYFILHLSNGSYISKQHPNKTNAEICANNLKKILE